jgi:flavin reductase (DIM6/NTAB) family NADH-FMN oxidoreductase RutF
MFYQPPGRDKTVLPHDPLKAIVAPRPIGWISTVSSSGVANLAPYSFFNMFSEDPWIVGFSSNTLKDSINNVSQTGEFVYNLATLPQLEAVNRSSVPAPPEIDEFDFAAIEWCPSELVKPRRVAASPCAFECKWIETIQLKGLSGKATGWHLVLGEVLGVYIDESVIENGRVDIVKMQTLARCGYMDYSTVETVLSRNRPTWPAASG